ncbi:MAG TPA: hypothetical protein VH000_11525, partial [Rhizomicrobium sp.]|nr:hypothetical protein [Rhizomicrobium sp.]
MIFDLSAAALRLLPPETAHRATIGLLSIGGGILPPAQPDDSQLALHVLGRDFPNPLGLAAGFDKNAQAP